MAGRIEVINVGLERLEVFALFANPQPCAAYNHEWSLLLCISFVYKSNDHEKY